MEKEGINYSYELSRELKNTFTTELLNPVELLKVKEINVNYDTLALSEIFKLELDGNVVYPDTPFHFELLDGM